MTTHTDAHTEKMPAQAHLNSTPTPPSAIPEGYIPLPFPAIRFDDHGNTKEVKDEKEDAEAKKEGFTHDAPPKPKAQMNSAKSGIAG